MRLTGRNFRSCLESWKRPLAMLCRSFLGSPRLTPIYSCFWPPIFGPQFFFSLGGPHYSPGNFKFLSPKFFVLRGSSLHPRVDTWLQHSSFWPSIFCPQFGPHSSPRSPPDSNIFKFLALNLVLTPPQDLHLTPTYSSCWPSIWSLLLPKISTWIQYIQVFGPQFLLLIGSSLLPRPRISTWLQNIQVVGPFLLALNLVLTPPKQLHLTPTYSSQSTFVRLFLIWKCFCLQLWWLKSAAQGR